MFTIPTPPVLDGSLDVAIKHRFRLGGRNVLGAFGLIAPQPWSTPLGGVALMSWITFVHLGQLARRPGDMSVPEPSI